MAYVLGLQPGGRAARQQHVQLAVTGLLQPHPAPGAAVQGGRQAVSSSRCPSARSAASSRPLPTPTGGVQHQAKYRWRQAVGAPESSGEPSRPIAAGRCMGGEAVALGGAVAVGRRSGPSQRHRSRPDAKQ
jgi:hypothetical protein